jgi:hypothetical protein
MLLEWGQVEERDITNLEKEITDKRRNGESVDSLIEKRRQIYEQWIARIDRELADPQNSEKIDELKKNRDRIVNQYG